MKERDLEQWISRSRDGELTPRHAARVKEVLADHPEGDVWGRDLEEIGRRLRERRPVPVQTPAAAWQDVRRAIRQGRSTVETADFPAGAVWRMRWVAGMAAVLLLTAGGWFALQTWLGGGERVIAYADRTEVEWVESDLPGAISMVYEDAATGLTVIWVMVDENGGEEEDV